jgi:hypothetical protein
MLFNRYKKIQYNIGNRTVDLCDLLTRVSFLDNYSSSKAFDEYYVQSGETPEDISHKIYGNESFSWIILLVNNILNEDEWYSGNEKLDFLLNKNHSGESYYITNLPAIIPGDVMVKVTASVGGEPTAIDQNTYRVIYGFDPQFRFVWGSTGTGSFASNDFILFGRKNNQTGSIDILRFASSADPLKNTKVTQIKHIEQKKDSPIYFKNLNNVVISPYSIYESGTLSRETIKSDSVFVSLSNTTSNENFARTLMYSYMTTSGTLPSGIQKYTYTNLEINKYKVKEKIKILKPEYLGKTIDTLKNLLVSNEIGKRIIIGF